MQIVLMWRARNSPASELGLERVATKLQQIFSPLFAETPKLRTFQNQALSLVYLELPVQGWRPAYLQEDDQTWSLSLDYPIHAKEALAGMGVHAPDDKVLPSLCRQMRLQPEPLLERMAPPFALIWAPKNAEEAFIQNDGLGYAQLFEYQDDQFWVMTNKIFALKALGITVKPVPEEWAVRSSMGWFPLKMTGFKNVRYPDPATQIHLTPRELTRKRFDVLSKWLKKDGLAVDECLELARSSINDYIQQASPLWDQASAGLTGGKDTRAIVSSLLACEAKNFYVRLRGQKTSYEVIIASQLAEIANLELRVEENHSLPPESVDSLKQMIGQALRWQAGYIEWRNHKIFLPLDRSYLLGGNINIMGQHGEVGRGNFTNHIKALDMTEDQYEDGLVAYLTQHKRPYLRPEYLDFVLETVRQAYRQADLYQLEGLDRLDFFHLFEKTRRWGSGGLYAQPGKVIAPFLNPGYIRATYNLPGPLRVSSPFHQHIINTNMPAWSEVKYARDLIQKEKKKKEKLKKCSKPLKLRKRIKLWAQTLSGRVWPRQDYRTAGAHDYDPRLYWQAVGKPLIDEILAQGGFWTEIYDPDQVRERWLKGPDDLAILHLLEKIAEE